MNTSKSSFAMKHQFILTVAILLGSTLIGFSQSDTKEELIQKALKIKSLATEGYENYDAAPLLEAAELLIETPQIRPFKSTDFPSAERSKYFDAKALLLAAYQFTPANQRWKRKKIEKRINQISDYETMAFSDGTLWVQEIKELESGQSLRFPRSFAAQQNIEFRLDNDGELSLSVHYAKEQPSLKKAAMDSPILLDFTTEKATAYEVEVKNLASAPALDSVLMIMY